MARSKPTGVTGRFSPFSRYLADRDLRALIEHMMGKENINSIEEEVKKMCEDRQKNLDYMQNTASARIKNSDGSIRQMTPKEQENEIIKTKRFIKESCSN